MEFGRYRSLVELPDPGNGKTDIELRQNCRVSLVLEVTFEVTVRQPIWLSMGFNGLIDKN